MRISSLAWREDPRNSLLFWNCRSTCFANNSNSSSSVTLYSSFLIRVLHPWRFILFRDSSLLSLVPLPRYISPRTSHTLLRVPPCSPRLSFLYLFIVLFPSFFDLPFPLSLIPASPLQRCPATVHCVTTCYTVCLCYPF